MIIKRDIIKNIENFLDKQSILVLHGARQVGKTSIMLYLIDKLKKNGEFVLYHDLEDYRYLEEYNKDIDSIILFWQSLGVNKNKINYVFIDEIQYLNNPSSFLKLTHDHCHFIKLIVSGSSSFEIKSKFKDSLVGRTINFEIFGLNFLEFLRFKNIKINFKKISSFQEKKLKNLWEEFSLFGTYPKIVLEPILEKKEILLKQIISTYINKDIKDLANIRNIQKFNNLLQFLAAQSGQLLNISELSNSLKISESTINEYLFILENTYIIKKVHPYYKNIRSELSKMPKIYFEDTGVLNIFLHKTLISAMNGILFENSCFSHFRKIYNTDYLYFWRTNTKKEIDFIIDFIKLKAIEIKYVFRGKKDVKHLKFFANNYKNSKTYICTLDKRQEIDKEINFIYPWEITN